MRLASVAAHSHVTVTPKQPRRRLAAAGGEICRGLLVANMISAGNLLPHVPSTTILKENTLDEVIKKACRSRAAKSYLPCGLLPTVSWRSSRAMLCREEPPDASRGYRTRQAEANASRSARRGRRGVWSMPITPATRGRDCRVANSALSLTGRTPAEVAISVTT